MDAKEEKAEEVVMRFQWLDNNTFRISNSEGIERLVDIASGFSEIEFNVIPLFDYEITKKKHLYLDRPDLKIEDTLGRLKRTY